MFIPFFFLLRRRGIKVSLSEWMTLLEALSKNAHQTSLSGFYYVCRAIIVHDEADFDKFDQAFLEFFKDVPFKGEFPDELMDWLNRPSEDLMRTMKELMDAGFSDEKIEELLKMLEERLKQQSEEHNGGNFWVGTQGRSPFGNSGWHPNGIRVGGRGRNRTAMSVAGERKFRDFRKDNILDTRGFQMAFRTLRQFTSQADTSEKELDVDATVRATGDNAGRLKIEYRPPRKNAIKVLMLMDSGGSMDYYSTLCSMLFQAAVKSNHFKELHTYYFHNCVYDAVYKSPSLFFDDAVETDWLMKNFDSEYRVIIVGDAMMNQSELRRRVYDWRTRAFCTAPGIVWLDRLKKHFPHLVWLNPEPLPRRRNYWTTTYLDLAEMFPMFQLTEEGLGSAMKHLMVRR